MYALTLMHSNKHVNVFKLALHLALLDCETETSKLSTSTLSLWETNLLRQHVQRPSSAPQPRCLTHTQSFLNCTRTKQHLSATDGWRVPATLVWDALTSSHESLFQCLDSMCLLPLGTADRVNHNHFSYRLGFSLRCICCITAQMQSHTRERTLDWTEFQHSPDFEHFVKCNNTYLLYYLQI